MNNELEIFLNLWNREADKTAELLRALPTGQYDFRPDPQARSLGELSWHLAELEAYTSWGIERPRSIEALAPGYERVHSEAVERIGKLTAADLDRKLRHFTGNELSIRDLLWFAVLFHMIHHRGQLSILCRLAGGTVTELYGPNREEMAALRAART